MLDGPEDIVRREAWEQAGVRLERDEVADAVVDIEGLLHVEARHHLEGRGVYHEDKKLFVWLELLVELAPLRELRLFYNESLLHHWKRRMPISLKEISVVTSLLLHRDSCGRCLEKTTDQWSGASRVLTPITEREEQHHGQKDSEDEEEVRRRRRRKHPRETRVHGDHQRKPRVTEDRNEERGGEGKKKTKNELRLLEEVSASVLRVFFPFYFSFPQRTTSSVPR